MLNLGVYDTQCGAKLFRCSDEVQALFETPFLTNWSFDVEILARLKHNNQMNPENSIVEHPLSNWREPGGSKVTLLDIPRALTELTRIYWHYLR